MECARRRRKGSPADWLYRCRRPRAGIGRRSRLRRAATSCSSSLEGSPLWLSSPTGIDSHPDQRSVHRWALRGTEWSDSRPHRRRGRFHEQPRGSFDGAWCPDQPHTVGQGRSELQPAWSHDGSQIAFLSSRAGRHIGPVSQQLLDASVIPRPEESSRSWSPLAVPRNRSAPSPGDRERSRS